MDVSALLLCRRDVILQKSGGKLLADIFFSLDEMASHRLCNISTLNNAHTAVGI